MPDGDVISSSVHHRWRSTLARFRAGASPEEVASHANRAIAEKLRSSGGVPGLAFYGTLVEARCRDELSLSEARSQARRIARSQEQTPFALIVLKAVDRWLTAPLDDAAALQPGTVLVAQAVCAELMNAELFEKVRPSLVGRCFADHDAFDNAVEHCRALIETGIGHISASLVRDPTAARLRASPIRRRSQRASTAAVLNQSIL
jgi:hypothetical protein